MDVYPLQDISYDQFVERMQRTLKMIEILEQERPTRLRTTFNIITLQDYIYDLEVQYPDYSKMFKQKTSDTDDNDVDR
jgi:hypothetical protein